MKILAMYLLIMGLGAWSLQAQPQLPDPTETAQKQTDRMTKELKLNAQQSDEVAKINLKYAQEQQKAMQELMQTRNFAGMQNKMESMHTAKDEEVKVLLNEDQKKKWKKLSKKMKNEMRPAGGPSAMMMN